MAKTAPTKKQASCTFI